MAHEKQDATQNTQPKTDAPPREIPVPTREQFLRDLRKVIAPPVKPQPGQDERGSSDKSR